LQGLGDRPFGGCGGLSKSQRRGEKKNYETHSSIVVADLRTILVPGRREYECLNSRARYSAIFVRVFPGRPTISSMKHLDGEAIEKYSLKRLDNAAAGRAEVHLFVCEQCRNHLDSFEFLLAVLRTGSGGTAKAPMTMSASGSFA
jgi:hypothetical protein